MWQKLSEIPALRESPRESECWPQAGLIFNGCEVQQTSSPPSLNARSILADVAGGSEVEPSSGAFHPQRVLRRQGRSRRHVHAMNRMRRVMIPGRLSAARVFCTVGRVLGRTKLASLCPTFRDTRGRSRYWFPN